MCTYLCQICSRLADALPFQPLFLFLYVASVWFDYFVGVTTCASYLSLNASLNLVVFYKGLKLLNQNSGLEFGLIMSPRSRSSHLVNYNLCQKNGKKEEEEEKVPYIWYTNIPKKVINLVLQRFFFLLIGKLHTSLMNFELIFNLTHFYLILTWEINHTAQGYHYHQHHSFTHGVVVQRDYKGKRKGCWGSGNESFFYS